MRQMLILKSLINLNLYRHEKYPTIKQALRLLEKTETTHTFSLTA